MDNTHANITAPQRDTSTPARPNTGQAASTQVKATPWAVQTIEEHRTFQQPAWRVRPGLAPTGRTRTGALSSRDAD
jgi:hypothetical protein